MKLKEAQRNIKGEASGLPPAARPELQLSRVGLALLLVLLAPACKAQEQTRNLELSRAARPWEFLCAVGTRAGLFGNEAGQMEAWVYPLKLLRDFQLRFHVDGRALPAESLVRTV